MVLPELSRTMAYTTRNTVNRIARKELNLNPVVLELSKEQETYHHGQKSWDKFAFVALFQTRQANSHMRIHLHLVSPSPQPPTYNVGHEYTLFLKSFNIVWGGGGGSNAI